MVRGIIKTKLAVLCVGSTPPDLPLQRGGNKKPLLACLAFKDIPLLCKEG